MSIPLPAILYKCPGPHEGRLNGKWVGYISIGAWTDEQLAKHLAAGWLPSLEAAHAAHIGHPIGGPKPEPVPIQLFNAEPAEDRFKGPSRYELETKAKELGVHFDGRTTDKLLNQRILDALGG